jgi:hypothetical protein
MTQRQGFIRLLLALAALGVLVLGRGLNSPPAGWVALSILAGAWVWTAWVVNHQRSST